MRTQEEIAEYIPKVQNKGFFWDATDLLLDYLDYDHAQSFLKPEVTREGWDTKVVGTDGFNPNKRHGVLDPGNREEMLADFLNYLRFAWTKAEDHRGLSADRSIRKLSMWCWLLGDEESAAFLDDETHYAYYGCPMLAYLSEKYGVEVPEDEGVQLMIQGLPCKDCE